MKTTLILDRALRTGLYRLAIICTGALAALSSACNDGGEDKGGPGVGQSVAGKNWTGSLYATDGTNRRALKATITQNRDAIVITTDLPGSGIARRLTGSFDKSGRIRVTDPYDGEIWSTYFGPAHGNYIKLADYTTRPVPGNGNDDFWILEISRNGGSRPPDVAFTAPNTTKDPDPVPPKPSTPVVTPTPTPTPPPTPAPDPDPTPAPDPDPEPTPDPQPTP